MFPTGKLVADKIMVAVQIMYALEIQSGTLSLYIIPELYLFSLFFRVGFGFVCLFVCVALAVLELTL